MNRKSSQKTSFLGGAVLLSIAAILTKIISAGYRIPFQNMAGDLGFYVYQQVYPFYGFMTIISLYGFPLVLSRQLAENPKKQRATTGFYFIGLLLFSVVTCVGMVVLAPWLAVLMGDPALTDVLRVTGLSFLFVPFLSVARGVTQGQHDMLPTAISNVGEQLGRVTAILLITYLLMNSSANAYQLGTGAIYGSLFGSLTGVILLFTFLHQRGITLGINELRQVSFGQITKQVSLLLGQSVFICINALVLILFQFVDVFSMIHLLNMFGLSEGEAYELKGVYDRGQPLIQLGTILATTLALALVPAMSEARARKEKLAVLRYQDMSLRLAFLIGGAATIGLVIIMEPLNHMLFTDIEGSGFLRVLVLSIAPAAVYLTAAAVLQGHGRIRVPVIILGIGLTLKMIANIALIPLYGAIGAGIATTIATITMASLGMIAIKRASGKVMVHGTPYVALSITLTTLAVATSICYGLIVHWTEISIGENRLHDAGVALVLSGIGGLVVLVCLLTLPVFTASEWDQIPKVKKIRGFFIRRKE
ncbi:oligosaccharide flippase family protein [Alkalihalobacillus sp. NPDC078783]